MKESWKDAVSADYAPRSTEQTTVRMDVDRALDVADGLAGAVFDLTSRLLGESLRTDDADGPVGPGSLNALRDRADGVRRACEVALKDVERLHKELGA